jgi:HD superfamily phosphohydrolase
MALRWIDTIEFQRLHHIRQTGVAYRVFPTATVSRFSHSIGTYHITRMLLDNLSIYQPDIMRGIDPRQKEWITIAGLLHDIGHGPFSHAFDQYLSTVIDTNERWCHHENRSIDIIAMMIAKYGWSDIDTRFIQSLVDPLCSYEATQGQWFQYIIANPIHGIDTDKMDYLVRDNHQFGLSMMIDVQRIIQNARIIDGDLCFCNKVQTELWNLFLIRHRLHATIYRHPRILKFEQELCKMFASLEDSEHLSQAIVERDMDAFLRWTDSFILVRTDSVLRDLFDTRTAFHAPDKRYSVYQDTQFSKLCDVWFYDRKNVNHKFHIPLPSEHCPFSIPI